MKNSIKLVAGAAAGLAATVLPASATTINYGLLTTIAIPAASGNPNPGGTFNSFDISYFDPVMRLDYVADRSNAGIDIFSGTTLSYVGRAGGFVGQQATTSASGPDGVLVANLPGGGQRLFGGDGNSTLKSFNVSDPAGPILLTSTATGGTRRVDEMAYSPTANLVLAANNADAPAFASLVNATTGAVVAGKITIPGAAPGDGLEQPVWNPNTNSFFVSVPQFAGVGAGGVAEIDIDGTVGRIYDFSKLGIASCSPTGLAIGASGNLLVGCGVAGTQTVLLDPATGKVVTTYGAVSGSDELYYDPGSNNYFVTGAVNGGRVFDVISDASNTILQSVALTGVTVNAHSVAVDPVNGYVYVPLEADGVGGANPVCAAGCIAVYAQDVPEPATLPVATSALFGLAGVGVWLRRRRGTVSD